MAPKIATGFDRLAIDLENHIKWYKPQSWVEHIGKVASVPMFESMEARALLAAYSCDCLDLALDGEKPGVPLYVREAVNDFFKKELYASSV